MNQPDFRSFEEFWPFYVREHAKKLNRTLHFVGSTAGLGLAVASLLTRRRALLLAAPIVGYGFAWFGHFFVEKNKPASFKHPAWSFQGDWLMWWKILNGTMDAEVERAMASDEAQGSTENGASHTVEVTTNAVVDPHSIN